jgi:putative oxidoreductase
MLTHGFAKLMNFATLSSEFSDPIGLGPFISLCLAVFAEVFCSMALILGIKPRFAVIPLIVTMVVASGIVHSADPFKKKEMAVLYLLGFVTILLSGGGAFQAKK